MIEILVVQAEAAHSSNLVVPGLVEALAHHQHGVVHDVGGALGHGVDANHVNDAYDALEAEGLSVKLVSGLRSGPEPSVMLGPVPGEDPHRQTGHRGLGSDG